MRRALGIIVLFVALALGLTLGMASIGGEVALADPTPGTYVQLPVLGEVAGTSQPVDWIIEAQNVGATRTKIALLLFAQSPGYCEPQVQAPFKMECTGLLKPGSSWIWTSNQVSPAARSAIAFSFDPLTWDCLDLDAFRKAGKWPQAWPGINMTPGGFPFDWDPFAGEPIAVEVIRRSASEGDRTKVVSAAYSGLSAMMDGRYDPVFGGFAYYAPVVYSGFMGMNSWLYLQNSGSACTSIELWFKAQDDCLRAQVCEVMALAPGYSERFSVAGCLPPGFVGSVWIRASQPLGIVVDQVGSLALMSYNGRPASLCFALGGHCADVQGGSEVLYGPLLYREQNGWDTRIYVQNMSGVMAAKVKVYFLDHKGGVITTLVDWVCPRGEQSFYLPLVNNLPGQYVGAVRVESQVWQAPGEGLAMAPPLAAVAELTQYASAARTTPVQAIAYNLFPQEQGYVWQVGCGSGAPTAWCSWYNSYSGVGLIAIPSFLQRGNALQVQTELAIQNLVPKPGFTDFALFVYDQNGLLDFVCEKLNEKQVEYIDLSTWGWISPGFKGSAVISATYWEHDVFDGNGQFVRNVVGLAAVKVERFVPQAAVAPGDVAAASEGFPIQYYGQPFAHFDFEGFTPLCPGQPDTTRPALRP